MTEPPLPTAYSSILDQTRKDPYIENLVIDLIANDALELELDLREIESLPIDIFVSNNSLKAGINLSKNTSFHIREACFTAQKSKYGREHCLSFSRMEGKEDALAVRVQE